MAAEAAAPAPVAAATAAPKRGAPSPAPGRRRRLPGEARSGLGSPRAGRSRCGEWEARPGLAGRDPLRRGAGRGLQGRGLVGGGAAQVGGGVGVLGQVSPPHLCASRGVSYPEMHGRRAQLLDLGPPRGALARRHSHPCHSRGGRPDWSPLLNAAKVLGSCGPAGSPLALPTRWAPAGASSRPGQRPPPRLPVHGRAPWEPLGPPGSACSQAGSPGPAPVASTGLPNISPGRAPHSCPSLSDVTLKVFIGVENSPHPHGFPRVLISGPGAPSIPVA